MEIYREKKEEEEANLRSIAYRAIHSDLPIKNKLLAAPP